MTRFALITLLVGASITAFAQNPYQYTIQKTATAKNGAVVSAHPLASQAGLLMLQKGGNAIDAAIATQLALAVVYPGAGNIGGGGFMVLHLADGRNMTLDFREKAPLAGNRDMYLNEKGDADLTKSQNGHLAAGVPGTIAGIFQALPYAKLPFKTIIQPAIDLAEKGFAITEAEAKDLNDDKPDFLKYNTRPTAFVKEQEWKAGDTLLQKDLAKTLERIRDHGQKGFYEGRTAQLIVAEMKRGKGLITLEDLKKYQAVWRTPVSFQYKGYEIITMPLPSSGGVLLPMMMKMTEKFPISRYGFHSDSALQLMTEIERLAYADRAKFLGDPDFYPVPVNALTSDEYINQRLKLYTPGIAGNSQVIQAGTVPKESEQTTHFNTADKDGNAVAITTTLNGGYGSHTVVGGAGFLLNNEMDDFSVKPGVPNMFGAVGGEANAIEPGKRMLSSMTPVIALNNGTLAIVTGTPGGTTITTSVYQTLLNLIDFNLSPADAVNKPKFHMQWLPDQVFVEKDFPQDKIEALQKMGYKVVNRGRIGRTELIVRQADGSYEVIGDSRGDDSAAGY
ncbi:MAG: gamma-glutamyltransferase [Bacteroidetes bacterium]|nr:gamma-glutamyltransferase [Bacteroidota bacterium]